MKNIFKIAFSGWSSRALPRTMRRPRTNTSTCQYCIPLLLRSDMALFRCNFYCIILTVFYFLFWDVATRTVTIRKRPSATTTADLLLECTIENSSTLAWRKRTAPRHPWRIRQPAARNEGLVLMFWFAKTIITMMINNNNIRCASDCGKNDCKKECAYLCEKHFSFKNRKEYEAEFNKLVGRFNPPK